MNRVEVLSSTSQARLARIAIPAATSADISADGATAWVGTALDKIIAIDSASLTVRNRYTLQGLTPIPNTIFNRPIEVLSLSSGKSVVRLRQPISSEVLLALWDPASNSLTNLTPAAPAVFQQGVGVLSRSGDHSKVLVAANDSSGELVVFGSGGNVVAGPVTLGAGLIPGLAANPDGSRNAAVFSTGSSAQIILLDGLLNQVSSYGGATLHGVAFSHDGKQLYAAESSNGASYITILDGLTGQLLGRVPDVSIQGSSSEIEDADETNLLFGMSNRGLAFVDASTPGTIATPTPSFASAPSAQPSEGPVIGGT
jgi:hypothetical protein